MIQLVNIILLVISCSLENGIVIEDCDRCFCRSSIAASMVAVRRGFGLAATGRRWSRWDRALHQFLLGALRAQDVRAVGDEALAH